MVSIPLPDNHVGIRAYLDGGTLRFLADEPFGWPPRGLNALGFGLTLLIAVLPLGAYAVASMEDWGFQGYELWLFHGIGLGFGLLFFATLAHHAVDVARFQESQFRRVGSNTFELTYTWARRPSRTCELREPVKMFVLLRTEVGGVTSFRKETNESGDVRRVTYHNVTDVELQLRAASASRRMGMFPRGWVQFIPAFFEVYHKHYNHDENCADAVELLRPLAAIVCETFNIPVEFRVVGGRVLETLEPSRAVG